jgi:hypothetical protein
VEMSVAGASSKLEIKREASQVAKVSLFYQSKDSFQLILSSHAPCFQDGSPFF